MEEVIKIKKEDIKVGNKVTCLSNSKPYVIAEANCRMKYDGDWHDCVIYTPLFDNPFKCFVRPVEDFVQNFVLDSVEEKKEKPGASKTVMLIQRIKINLPSILSLGLKLK